MAVYNPLTWEAQWAENIGKRENITRERVRQVLYKINIGDTIKIINMKGEPHYKGREGVVTHIDDAGQIHGTRGSCALIPNIDTYVVTASKGD